MKEIIDNLKSNEILYEQSIEILKNYIAMKFPDENEPFRARVFADAVHKIIDDHIREFRRDDQKAIKKELLTNAVDRNSFEINAYDILKTCVALELDEEVFAADLSSWINHQQDIPVEPTMIHQLTEVVKEELQSDIDSLETTIDASILEVDEVVDQAFEPIENKQASSQNGQDGQELTVEATYAKGLTNQFEADLMAQLEAAFSDADSMTLPTQPISASTEDVFADVYKHVDSVDMEEKDKVEEKEVEFYDEFLSDGLVVSGLKTNSTVASESLNMFNLADTIYSEEEEEEKVEELLDEDRPVIKIERERQMDVLDEIEEEEPIAIPVVTFREQIQDWIGSGLYKRDLKSALPFLIAFIVLVIVLYLVVTRVELSAEAPVDQEVTTTLDVKEDIAMVPQGVVSEEALIIRDSKRADGSHLHERIQYKDIDQEKLKTWLVRRNSLLAEDEYFNVFIEVAEDYDVNPLLLFAIAGQEQNFVQMDHQDAMEMINNPFNVYVSWEDFNTNLLESTQIASRTIHTLSEGLPQGEDPIRWINESGYAEDDRWHLGVTLILEQLEVVAGNP